MGRTESIVTGLWRNHDLPAWKSTQLLVSEERAQMITNTVAVALALTLPRLLVFVKLALPFCLKQLSRCRDYVYSRARYLLNRQNGTPANLDISDVIPLEPPRARIAAGAAQTFNNSSSFDDAAARIVRDHLAMSRIELTDERTGFWGRCVNALQNLREDVWTFAWLSTISVLLFLVFLGQQIIAICAANIVSDSTALVGSPHCGVWLTPLYSKPKLTIGIGENLSVTPVSSFPDDRTRKAVYYAETCYGNDSRPEECRYFYKSRIPFREVHNSSCPFGGDVCLYGNSSAYTLDTGFLDSNILGFNEAHRCQFRLQSTCAPLVTSEPYVRSEPVGQDGTKMVYYYFGNIRNISHQDRNLTFNERFRVPNFQSLIFKPKKYHIEVYPSVYDRPVSYHRFRPELQVPYSHTTIFFVASDMLFTAPSDDPVFPAVPARAYANHGTIYWNNLQRRTIFACADSVEFRHPRSGAIWYPEFSNDSELRTAQWRNPSVVSSVRLLNLTLTIPENFKASLTDKSTLFEVHKKLASFTSTPLAREQWKVEARRLLDIRLARLQMDVLGVAQGLGHDFPLAKDALRENGGSEACARIKFRAYGWKNVSLAGLVGLLLLAMLIWMATVEVGDSVALVWWTREIVAPVLRRLGGFAAGVVVKYAVPIWHRLIGLTMQYLHRARRAPRQTP